MLKDKDAKVTARSFGAGFLAKNANQVHAKTDVCRKDAVQNHIPADTKAWAGNIVWQSRILGGVSRFSLYATMAFYSFLNLWPKSKSAHNAKKIMSFLHFSYGELLSFLLFMAVFCRF